MAKIPDLWQRPTPIANRPPEYLENERDRWLALLSEPQSFFRNALKYGPLTVEGFQKLRFEYEYSKHDSWPKDPIAIADLLVQCGVDEYNAVPVVQKHMDVLDNKNDMTIASVLAIHIGILNNLDVDPAPDLLLNVLTDFPWGHCYFEEYVNSFTIMLDYLPTAEAETDFLYKWLPTLERSIYANGSDQSLGMAVAASFTRANADSIIEWCKNNDDPVGLGYLVWQDRLPLVEWLQEIADPSTHAKRRGASNIDSSKIFLTVECIDTLRLLAKRVPKNVLTEQGAIFRQEYPDLLKKIFSRCEVDDVREEKFQWAMALLEAQVIDVNEPLFVSCIDDKCKQQEHIIVLLQNNHITDKNFILLDAIHYHCGPVTKLAGEKARHFLVRDLVLNANVSDLDSQLLQMPDRTWLKDVPILDVIAVRTDLDTRRRLTYLMYPFMSKEEQLAVIPMIVTGVVNKHVWPSYLCDMLAKLSDDDFNAKDSGLYEGNALILHQLTRKDPRALFSSIELLEINEDDPVYLQMLQDWTMAQLNPNQEIILNMPNDILGDGISSI